MSVSEVWPITGIPGAGKSTVARGLGARFERAVHIEGDMLLDDWVVSGAVLPGEEPRAEASRQIQLCIKNQCLLAESYAEAGFVPVLDFVVPSKQDLAHYERRLGEHTLCLVVLEPAVKVALSRDVRRSEKTVAARWLHLDAETRSELKGTGLWVDSSEMTVDETIEYILLRKSEAVLTRRSRHDYR